MREGFVKNRYIGRTFIMPGQSERVKSVRRKLNPIGLEFRKKNVLLVDDSIVRGTTSKQIIQMAREAGAQESVLRLRRAAGALSERLRHRHAGRGRARRARPHDEEVQQILGADWLVYQDLDDLIWAVRDGNENLTRFRHVVLLRRIRDRRRADVSERARVRAFGRSQDAAPPGELIRKAPAARNKRATMLHVFDVFEHEDVPS